MPFSITPARLALANQVIAVTTHDPTDAALRVHAERFVADMTELYRPLNGSQLFADPLFNNSILRVCAAAEFRVRLRSSRPLTPQNLSVPSFGDVAVLFDSEAAVEANVTDVNYGMGGTAKVILLCAVTT